LRAFVVSRDVFGLNQLWSDLENLDGKVSTDCQTELFLESRRLLDRATRWFLQSRGGRLNVEEEIAKFAPIVAKLTNSIPGLLRGVERERAEGIAKKYQAQGVPTELAIRTGSFLDEFSLLDVIEIANRQNSSPEVVAELYFALSERYDIDRMLFHISALARDDRWTAYALTSRVVQATKDSDSIDVRISQWEAKFAEGVARTRATLNEIAHSEQNDLATLSVALRAIRTLAGQGAS
jgi:glutamate dehydrogenase